MREVCVVENEERRRKIWVLEAWELRTAVPPQTRVVPRLLEFCGFWVRLVEHGRATTGTGRATASGHMLNIFSRFSPHFWTITYKTN